MNNNIKTHPDEIGIAALQSQLIQADAAEVQGNFVEAERLSQQVLASLSRMGEAEQTDTEHTTLQAEATRMLGVVCLRRGDYAEAEEHLHAALHTSEQMRDKAGIAKSLGSIGNVYYELGDYPKALEYHGNALILAEELDSKLGIAKHLGNIGNVHKDLSDYPKAMEYFFKALSIAEELGYMSGVGTLLCNIGNVYKDLSDYPKALEYYGKALGIAEELGNKVVVATCLGNIGNVHRNLSDYPKALEYLVKALGIAEELANKSGVARHLGNIGNVHLNLSNYSKALKYYGKALGIDEELGNMAGVARHLGNMGVVYMNLSDYPKALEYLVKALILDEELGNKTGVANHLGNIGEMQIKQRDYAKAQEYLERGLSLMEDLGMKSEAGNSKSSLGELYASESNPYRDESKAEAYLLESIAVSEELGTKHYEAHKTLADLYEKQKRWDEAYYHLGKYFTLEKEVQSEEARKKAQLMEQQKQIADREKEIAIAKAAADAQMSATTTLLYKVLPESVATRMIGGEEEIADYYTSVSILFADVVGFTPIAAQMQARDVMRLLNHVFGEFDRIMEKHGCQKIKTMGDGYMAVCGAPIACDDHAEKLANAALDLLNDIVLPESLRSSLPKGSVFHLRIGLHCGPAFAGIVGEKGFVYDVYSDAVNLASRMESHGEPGRIHCSEDFKNHLGLRLHALRFAERGEIEIKGKGIMRTYFLERV